MRPLSAMAALVLLCSAVPSQAGNRLDAGDLTATAATCVSDPPSHDAIEAMYDKLVSWWGSQFGPENPMWKNNPLQIEINDRGYLHLAQGKDVPPSTWHYKGIAELSQIGNLEFEQWTSVPHEKQWKYKWFVYDPKFIETLDSKANSNFAWVTAFAHEFGHYVQNIGGRGGSPTKQPLFPAGPEDPGVADTRATHTKVNKELDADRLAGAFVAANFHSPACVDAAKAVLMLGSDRTTAAVSHGTSTQRHACFLYGYRHGVHPFYVGDSGNDLIGNAERASQIADCSQNSACKDKTAATTGQSGQMAMRMESEQTSEEDTDCRPDEPKIGPPIVTGGSPACVKNVFEKDEGCVCPSGAYPQQLGKDMGPHTMIWCRSRGPRM